MRIALILTVSSGSKQRIPTGAAVKAKSKMLIYCKGDIG
jgi:hypothetical protein